MPLPPSDSTFELLFYISESHSRTQFGILILANLSILQSCTQQQHQNAIIFKFCKKSRLMVALAKRVVQREHAKGLYARLSHSLTSLKRSASSHDSFLRRQKQSIATAVLGAIAEKHTIVPGDVGVDGFRRIDKHPLKTRTCA